MRYKVIEEIVKRNNSQLDSIKWSNISRCSSKEFIIKHKDDPNYLFSWADIAENKNIDLDFVQKYMDYFTKEQVLIQLNKHILVDKEFILCDHHIHLSEEYRRTDLDLTYTSIYTDDNRCSKVCDNYEKFLKDYEPRNNPYNCSSCGDYDYLDNCYSIVNHLYKHLYIDKDKYYILFYKSECYIIKKYQLNIACEILKNNELKTKRIPIGNESILKILSKNKSISLQEKFDTRDTIKWNWRTIMYEHEYEIDLEWYSKIKQYIKEEDLYLFQSNFSDLSHQFLDDILNDKEELELLLRMIDDIYMKKDNEKKEYYKILRDYPSKNELIDKLVKYSKDENTYRVDFKIFTIMASIDKIKQNLNVDWNLNEVFRRKEADFEFLKLLYNYRKENTGCYFGYKIPWDLVSTRSWVTEELILNNLDLPWNIFSERDFDYKFDENFDISDAWN